MLKELENLLTEIARQQGVDVGPRKRQQAVRPEPDLVDAEIIEAEPIRADAVRRVGSSSASVHDIHDSLHSRSLSDQQEPSEDRRDLHVHERFDERTSHTEDSAYDEDVERNPLDAANWVAALFRDPQRTRQAIILREILTRPTDFW
ncbi:MAG: hypothetical protein EA424_19550 [Planctomycetaceae bacterium]|nr:MAG: hypothetical protein EA424_19550 [Planctomycetaceae bacterium]